MGSFAAANTGCFITAKNVQFYCWKKRALLSAKMGTFIDGYLFRCKMGIFIAAKMQFYCCDYGQYYRGKKRSFVCAKMGGLWLQKREVLSLKVSTKLAPFLLFQRQCKCCYCKVHILRRKSVFAAFNVTFQAN